MLAQSVEGGKPPNPSGFVAVDRRSDGWIGAVGRSAPLMSPDPRLRRGSPPNTSLRRAPHRPDPSTIATPGSTEQRQVLLPVRFHCRLLPRVHFHPCFRTNKLRRFVGSPGVRPPGPPRTGGVARVRLRR